MCSFAVFPVIVARVIHQDPDLTDVQSEEEEEIVSVFQFEHYFMDLCRSVCSQRSTLCMCLMVTLLN